MKAIVVHLNELEFRLIISKNQDFFNLDNKRCLFIGDSVVLREVGGLNDKLTGREIWIVISGVDVFDNNCHSYKFVIVYIVISKYLSMY